MSDELPILTVVGVPIKKAADDNKLIVGLAWADAGAGKTTLGATMPGKKLFFQFDPRGTDSVAHVPDVDVADFSGASASITEQFKNENNPLGILPLLPLYDSFLFDSLTNITDKTLTQGISKNNGATIERPSPGSYGTRNALAIRLIKNVIKVCGKAGKHVMFIAHEGAPTTDEKTGSILHISLALGGQLPSNIGIDFSEMWAMYQVDNRAERRIAIRPSRLRKPMKSRMFIQTDEPEFTWAFDPDDWDKESNDMMRMDTWYAMWCHFNAKLPLPGTPKFIAMYKEWRKLFPK